MNNAADAEVKNSGNVAFKKINKIEPRNEYFRVGRDTVAVDEFSEGESGSEFPVTFSTLKRSRKIQRVVFLWRKAFARSLVGARLVQACHGMHQGLLKMGSTKNLFGSKQHLVDMRELKKKRRCLLLPADKFKTFWTIVIVVLLVYTAIFVPYKIAFIEEAGAFLEGMEATVDILFGVDIVVNFISAVEDSSGKLIIDHKTIAKNYMSGWFWLDFLACFPFNLIPIGGEASAASGNQQVLRLARLPRLYRLVRLLRMIKMLRVLKNSRIITEAIELLQVNPALTRLTKILFGVLYLVHIFACIWFFVANFNSKYDCWVDQLGLWDEPGPYKYMVSVYWAF